MTSSNDFTLPPEILEQIATEGFDILPELIRIVVNTAMQVERQKHLGAAPFERSPDRRGQANGFKPKTVKTRLGEITFDIPQVRQGGFYPEALEKGLRSERALRLTLAEMYVQGVSTRKVAAITQQLCGTDISSSQVSRAVARLDETLEAWRHRPLGEIVYLFLDARYENVRQDGQVRDAAVLIASGVGHDGKRQILGVSVSLSEQEVHWRTFLQSLVFPRLEWRTAHHQRRSRRPESGAPGRFWRHPLAEVPVPLAAERQHLRAPPGTAQGSGGRDPHGVQCPRPANCRGVSDPDRAEICQNGLQVSRLVRKEPARRADRAGFSRQPSPQDPHSQRTGARE